MAKVYREQWSGYWDTEQEQMEYLYVMSKVLVRLTQKESKGYEADKQIQPFLKRKQCQSSINWKQRGKMLPYEAHSILLNMHNISHSFDTHCSALLID